MQDSNLGQTNVIDQLRPLIPTDLFEEVSRAFEDSIKMSHSFRKERKEAREAQAQAEARIGKVNRKLQELSDKCQHAQFERDLFRTLLQVEEQAAIKPCLSSVLDALIALSRAEKGICMVFAAPNDIREKPAELVARNCDEEDVSVLREQLELSEGIVKQALSTKSMVYTEEAIRDNRFREHASVRLFRLKTVLCVPLVADGDGVLGVIYLEHRGRRNAFPESDRVLIDMGANHLARWVNRQRIVSAEDAAHDKTVAYRERYGFKEIVGRSKALAGVLRLMTLSLDLKSNVPVLITGESGTGKELVARALHFNSPRARGPFVPVNCGAIPDSLIESTLFGHKRGAFTGADRNQSGKFEAADGGTLFLDEVAELSQPAQVKLLRVLQDGEVVRLGDHVPRKVDVRVVAATHRDLRQLMLEGRFREDLIFRLDVFAIHIPPLRERIEDIPLLSEHFMEKHNQESPQPIVLSTDAIAFLQHCALPGNVRELQNRLTRAFLHATNGVVTAALLASTESGAAGSSEKSGPVRTWKEATAAFQRQLLVEALRHTNRNLQEAAAMLGISRQHLSRLLHDLDLNEYRPAHRGRKRKV